MQLEILIDQICEQLNESQAKWFNGALHALKTSADPMEDLFLYSAMIKRKFAHVPQVRIALPNITEPSELGRLVLCQQVLSVHDVSRIQLVKAYYQAGDSSEKAALLKGLNWLDNLGEAVDIAVRAARANSLDEFSALALNNTYPSTHFADLNFNQLVLKALFLGLQIDNLLGLNNRLSAQLSNMCFSYVVEQALAERTPPASIWLAIRHKDLEPEYVEVFAQYVTHFKQSDTAHNCVLSEWLTMQSISL